MTIAVDLGRKATKPNQKRNTISVLNSLDPDQARHFVGPGLVQTVCKNNLQVALGNKIVDPLYTSVS